MNPHVAQTLTQFFFASASVIAETGLGNINPVLFTFIRSLVATPILYALWFLEANVCHITNGQKRRPTNKWVKKQATPEEEEQRKHATAWNMVWRHPKLVFLSCLFLCMGKMGTTVGIKLTSSVTQTIYTPSQQFFALAVGVCMGSEKASTLKLLGMLCGFVSCVFMVLLDEDSHSSDSNSNTNSNLAAGGADGGAADAISSNVVDLLQLWSTSDTVDPNSDNIDVDGVGGSGAGVPNPLLANNSNGSNSLADTEDVVGHIVLALACFGMACYFVSCKRLLSYGYTPLTVVSWVFSIDCVFSFVAFLLSTTDSALEVLCPAPDNECGEHGSSIPMSAVFALLYMGIVSTAFAFPLSMIANQRLPPSVLTAYTVLQPVTACAISTVVIAFTPPPHWGLSEASATDLLGSIGIFAGLGIVLYDNRLREQEAERENDKNTRERTNSENLTDVSSVEEHQPLLVR